MTDQTQEIVLTRIVHTPPSRVYAAFTHGAGWCAWCCETAEIDAKVGGKLHIYTEGYHAYGQFTLLEQDRIIAFTFDGDREPPTHIHISLDEQEDGTHLTYKVTITGSEPNIPGIADFLDHTWGRALNNLKAVLEIDK